MVSVVVPTYNRLPYLKKCIESLLRLEYEVFEIIIVNDCSSDGTKEYLETLDNPRIKVHHNTSNRGKSQTRNQGVKLASYAIVAFIDDDCAADSKWLDNLTQEFTKENTVFVIGQTLYVREGYQGYFPERMVRNLHAVWPGAGNIAYRKDVFLQLGGFQSAYDYYNNEDTELAIRAVDRGFSFSRNPRAIVYHQPMDWTVRSLLNSARNASVWPVLKKKYPLSYHTFGPPISWNTIVHREDYLYLFGMGVVVPILLVRYSMHGKRDWKIFFAKWPLYFILRRYFIFKQAITHRVLMI